MMVQAMNDAISMCIKGMQPGNPDSELPGSVHLTNSPESGLPRLQDVASSTVDQNSGNDSAGDA